MCLTTILMEKWGINKRMARGGITDWIGYQYKFI